jgi:predicted AlkP superfamily pyrophosphatase or phosphodiesterase
MPVPPPNQLSRRVFSCRLLLVLLSAVFVTAQPVPKITDLKPTVILVSIDGFRYDYLDRGNTPNLQSIAKRGVRAEWMTPSFPTKTFPNHYTIVTGLYPEHHGIVGNDFWDNDRQQMYKHDKPIALDGSWWGGEPIWLTAERQGIKAGTLFWPGAEALIQGKHATYWHRYEHDMPVDQRAQIILDWIDKSPSERPQLLTLYFHHVDTAGHDYGPDSPEVNDAMKKVDGALGLLLHGLRARGIEKQVNIIVVSDHGMVSTPVDKKIFIDDYIDPKSLRLVVTGQYLSANPVNGDTDAAIAALRKAPHLTVYRKCEMPARFHYCDNKRIDQIIGIPDEGWEIYTREKFANEKKHSAAGHGFDNMLPRMRATFVAAGPGLMSGKRIAAFPNVDVYSLLCHLLGIQPALNDGTLEPFRSVLRK